MNLSNEQIAQEFVRQVSLCRGAGYQAMRAALDAQFDEAGWIHLDDRLPGIDEWVLIYVPTLRPSVRVSYLYTTDRGKGDRALFQHEHNDRTRHATHWMPLPPLPTQGND